MPTMTGVCGGRSRVIASLTGVDRGPLLLERLHALTRVARPEDGAAVLELFFERLVLAIAAVDLAQHAHEGTDRLRRVRRDVGGELLRLGERVALRHEPADEPERERLARGHVAAGEKDLGGERVG